MKVCLKASLSKNLHHAETRQLTLTECQRSGLKAALKGAFEKTLKSLKMLKFVKNTLKFLKSLLKGLFREDIFMKDLFTDK